MPISVSLICTRNSDSSPRAVVFKLPAPVFLHCDNGWEHRATVTGIHSSMTRVALWRCKWVSVLEPVLARLSPTA